MWQPPPPPTLLSWTSNSSLSGLASVDNNIYTTDGTAYTVGRLSVKELQTAADSLIGQHISLDINKTDPRTATYEQERKQSILSNCVKCLQTNLPVLMYSAQHYTVCLPLSSGVFLFDSLDFRSHTDTADLLRRTTQKELYWMCRRWPEVLPVQGLKSDLCGCYCLFVMSLWHRNAKTLTLPGFESLIVRYLPPGQTLQNDFNIQVWAIQSRIGEEFDPAAPAYVRTQAIMELTLKDGVVTE